MTTTTNPTAVLTTLTDLITTMRDQLVALDLDLMILARYEHEVTRNTQTADRATRKLLDLLNTLGAEWSDPS